MVQLTCSLGGSGLRREMVSFDSPMNENHGQLLGRAAGENSEETP